MGVGTLGGWVIVHLGRCQDVQMWEVLWSRAVKGGEEDEPSCSVFGGCVMLPFLKPVTVILGKRRLFFLFKQWPPLGA